MLTAHWCRTYLYYLMIVGKNYWNCRYLPNCHQINKKIDIFPTTVQLKQSDEFEMKIFLWISTQTYVLDYVSINSKIIIRVHS